MARWTTLVALGIVLASAAAVRSAQPPAAFDHSDFDGLLRRHVVRGDVDYDAFAAAPGFRRYLDALAGAELGGLGREEQLALWINAYNAYTIRLINVKGERESIRNINKTLGLLTLKGPWQEPLARVAGTPWTLDQIEHEIVRPRFREPRIHFALVCAARSCPWLRSEAYVGARLEAQLEEETRRFLTERPEANRVDLATRTLHLSPIFVWFKEDFGDSDAAVGRFVARYLPPGPARELARGGALRLVTTPYDWSLNAQRPPAAAR